MDNEITDLYLDVSNGLEHDCIKLDINNIIKMNESINNLNNLNNNFDNNNYVNSIINSNLIQDYIQKMNELVSKLEVNNNLDDNNNLETLKTQIIELIKKRCKHNWVRDYIDIDPECSQPIIYCSYCEATKKI
jgi:hypothetical protein